PQLDLAVAAGREAAHGRQRERPDRQLLHAPHFSIRRARASEPVRKPFSASLSDGCQHRKPLRSAPCVSRAASRALVSREAPAASPSRASGCVSVTLRMFHEDVGGIFQATEKRTRNAALTRAGDDRSWSE